MLLCADAESASAALASGALTCPSCGTGRLRPWGHGREREIRMGGGQRERVRPRRGLCRSCRATHILLPSWAAPRRADAIGVIARAAALSALHGTGSARLGAQIGVPAAHGTRLAAAAARPGRPAAAGGHRELRVPRRGHRDPRRPRSLPAGANRVGPGRRAGRSRRMRVRRDQVARPPGSRPGRADRPVRPGRRPRPDARELIPPPRPGAPMPSSPQRRPA